MGERLGDGSILKLTWESGGGLMGFGAGDVVIVVDDHLNPNPNSRRIQKLGDFGAEPIIGYLFLESEFEIIEEAK